MLAALRLGGLAAGADPPQSEALQQYGRRLGLAFQITDDLLDVVGRAEQAGKRVGKDAARNKLTYPGLLGVEASRQRAQELGRNAIDFVAPFGTSAGRLVELVSFVLTRDR